VKLGEVLEGDRGDGAPLHVHSLTIIIANVLGCGCLEKSCGQDNEDAFSSTSNISLPD
jgi:hypothetical protein